MERTYTIRILPTADKELRRVPTLLRQRLAARIDALADDPHGRGVTKLRGREGCRLRVGSWRVLFLVDDDEHVVTVAAVGPRKEIYRR